MKYYFMVLVGHGPYSKDMGRPTTEDKYLRAFGARLASLREARGLSQENFSARVGLSRETISHLENGRQWAHLSTLHKLAKALGIQTKELLDGLKQ